MRQVTTVLLMLFSLTAFTQDTLQGCLFLDFENIDDLDLFEGIEMSDQFEDEFGLTFSLEGGGFPVLAEIGGNPPAAYGSAWGNDTPDPQDASLVGSFFLTDDGILAGLDSPPILLDFATPIDSFAGCIMDMDFGEVFKIEAFDIMGAIILEDSIMAGDPNTGDGRATCWGFNIGGCTGTVSQIKFSGYRTTAGAFGLGLDNFSFCYAGVAGTENFAICESDSVVVNGETFTDAGIYEQELQSSIGCDSLVYINVEVYPEYQMSDSYTACSGEVIIVNGQSYDESGTYVQEMQTAQGCDSTLTITLNILETYEILELFEICEGDTIIIEGEEISNAGIYEFIYTTQNGCDSLIIADVNTLTSVMTSASYAICEGDSIEVAGVIYTEAGNYDQLLQTVDGCDSILLLEIAVNPTFEVSEAYSFCDNESVIVNGVEYTTSGTFDQILQTAQGCDSILSLQIEVFSTFAVEEEYTFCENESIIINGVEYTQEGTYTQNLETVNSCDSTLSLVLNVLPTSDEFITYTIIEGEVISVNGEDYSLAGTYDQLLEATNGCDSLLVIELEVLPPNAEVFVEFEIANCVAGGGLSEFGPSYPTDLGCGSVSASSLDAVSHSCTDGIDASGALCISSSASCTFEEDSQNGIRFNLNIEASPEKAFVITQLSFYEKAPLMFLWANGNTGENNYPTKYALRIFRDNVEVYRQVDLATERDWNLESFDLTGIADFRIEDNASYQVELTPYCANTNAYTVRAWDLDQISLEGYCSEIQTRVKGRISSASDLSTLEDVQIFLHDGENEISTISDSEGFYAFEELVTTTYNVRAHNDTDHLEGVSALDLILLQKHLLGIKPLEEENLLIAGDINRSGHISAIDLIDLRKTLLGIHSAFPNNTSWRFFESDDYELNASSEEVEITKEQLKEINWQGVKIGDINKSISNLNDGASNRSVRDIDIQIVREEVEGQEYIHFVTLQDFTLDGLQMSCIINGGKINEIYNSSIGLTDTDIHFTENGFKMIFVSDDTEIKEGQILFSLKANADLEVSLELSQENAMFSSQDLEPYNIQFIHSEISATAEFENLIASPNPFTSNTIITFDHGIEESATVYVVDIHNRVVLEKPMVLNIGQNKFEIEEYELNATGTYTLMIKTKTSQVISKLVHIE